MYIPLTLLAGVMGGIITQTPTPSHPAYDISCRIGRPIHALYGGHMTSQWSSTHGNTITIKGAHGSTFYAHLEATQPEGYYEQGQLIGTCGNTGKWSTGPHLHIEHQPHD